MREDQMVKLAQFKNNKIKFTNDSDYPDNPGIYKFFDSSEKILYIGKAKNLNKRLSSYFSSNRGDGKRLKKLKSSIKYVEIIITNTESDALILEQGLISKIKPPFNVQFRDDKSYPAIHFSTNNVFPGVYVSRKKDKNVTIFGPYANISAMRLNVDLIRSIFKIRNCKDINFKNRSRPCIEFQMNRCSAPCVGKISKEDYALDVENAINFLSGNTEEITQKLTQSMDNYSAKKDYERAIIYRDKIKAIRDTQRRQNVLTNHKNLEVFSIRKNSYSCCISLLKIEDGWINSSKNYYPEKFDGFTESDLLSFFLEKYISENKSKNKLNLLPEIEINKDTKRFIKGLKKPFIQLIKISNKNKNLIDICSSQAEDALQRNNNFLWIKDAFISLENFLSSKKIERIEAFDISHTSGNQVSASCIALNEDGPDKKNYRIMNIKREVNNDYAALVEAVTRRLKNLLNNKKKLPEVILIDGGKVHLKTILNSLEKELTQKIKFISISKGPNRNEKYDFLHTENESNIELKKELEISKLLQLVRNESHRFAISQHRKRRSKSLLNSDLDNLLGVGPKLKISLIRHFGGVNKVYEASLDDLKAVPGIGDRKAKEIYISLK